MSFFPPLTSKGLQLLKAFSTSGNPSYTVGEMLCANPTPISAALNTTTGIKVPEVLKAGVPQLTISGTDATYFENSSPNEMLLNVEVSISVLNDALAEVDFTLGVAVSDGTGGRFYKETSPIGGTTTILYLSCVIILEPEGYFHASVIANKATEIAIGAATVRVITLQPRLTL